MARRRRPLRRLMLAVLGAAVVGVAIGFVTFAESVVRTDPPGDPRADGIVVLTGGTGRIDGAMALLAEGRAQRLLISGVNPNVSRDVIADMVGDALRPAIDCCVDIDHARDTVDNANSAGRWASDLSFSSLIVVTSSYHMPRSMAELESAMPGVRLIAFPVANPELDLEGWWRNPSVFSLLAREYGKFLAAEARLLIRPRTASAAAAR